MRHLKITCLHVNDLLLLAGQNKIDATEKCWPSQFIGPKGKVFVTRFEISSNRVITEFQVPLCVPTARELRTSFDILGDARNGK